MTGIARRLGGAASQPGRGQSCPWLRGGGWRAPRWPCPPGPAGQRPPADPRRCSWTPPGRWKTGWPAWLARC